MKKIYQYLILLLSSTIFFQCGETVTLVEPEYSSSIENSSSSDLAFSSSAPEVSSSAMTSISSSDIILSSSSSNNLSSSSIEAPTFISRDSVLIRLGNPQLWPYPLEKNWLSLWDSLIDAQSPEIIKLSDTNLVPSIQEIGRQWCEFTDTSYRYEYNSHLIAPYFQSTTKIYNTKDSLIYEFYQYTYTPTFESNDNTRCIRQEHILNLNNDPCSPLTVTRADGTRYCIYPRAPYSSEPAIQILDSTLEFCPARDVCEKPVAYGERGNSAEVL